MKEWTNPEIEVVEITNTQYGGTVVKQFDYVYQNAEGNWEGTFVPDEEQGSGR